MNTSELLTLDVECYKNYVLVMFKKFSNGQVIYFEKFEEETLSSANLLHILNKYTMITFNGIKYDIVILEAIVAGFSIKAIHAVSKMLIGNKAEGVKGLQPWQVRKQVGIAALHVDHIDLIEVAPLTAGLKIYGGRMHTKKMQDLPIHWAEKIRQRDRKSMIKYCENDNDLTKELFEEIEPELDLRVTLGEKYNIDLRSKSDAQIAEAVIKSELKTKYNVTAKKPIIKSGTVYKYIAPDNLIFETPVLQDLLRQYEALPFTIDGGGYTQFNFELVESDRFKTGKRKGEFPEKKRSLKFVIGNTKYTAGIGGLHSVDKKTRHTNDEHILREYDVASFYPRIILNNNLAPTHLGLPFLEVYSSIVERRLKAKAEGDKVTSDSLKITINGSFGKLGSKHSCLYAPNLMMQVTITGQLSLLMLIERLELAGISVVSANTDGIVLKMDELEAEEAAEIVEDWEFDTDYVMESTDYMSLNSRDVNNYIAVKPSYTDKKGVFHPVESKGKGVFSDHSDRYYTLRSNPASDICATSVRKFLEHGTPLEDTIYECDDIKQFVTIRTVNGDAVKEGKVLGKAIRWYYGAYELDAIYYNTNGNMVPKSLGAVPLMDLPDKFPDDIDFAYYVEEARKMLKGVGYK